MSGHDAVFEPLLGKRRTVHQALSEVAERWTRIFIDQADVRFLRLGGFGQARDLRGEIDGELPAGTDAAALARAFVAGLVAGEGTGALSELFRVG